MGYLRCEVGFNGFYDGCYREALKPKVGSPMYGRQPAILRLYPFSREKSREFLVRGFKEYGMVVSEEELDEVVETLNGYVGWLTYYGNYRCVRRLSHREALEKVYDEGKLIMLEELKRFLKNRRNQSKYVELLRSLPARWSELERKLRVNRKVLRDMLRSLEDAMIVEKKGLTYTIPDPILRRLVLELRI